MNKRVSQWMVGAMLLSSVFGVTLHPASAQAASGISVTINGQQQSYDQPPVIVHDRTVVPLRGIFEALGATVNWDGSTQTVTATKGNTTIVLKIGSTQATKNGQPVTLDVAAQLIAGHTMVPVRFVSEALGADVKWDAGTNTVVIQTSPAKDQTPTTDSNGSNGTAPSNGSGGTASTNGQDLTVEQIGKYSDRVVLVEVYDKDGNLFATGSGFVVGSNGLIVTNHHVIDGAAKAKIIFADNTSYTTSTLLNDDPQHDLALLKIDASNLPYVTVGDSSKLQLGQQVVAIGSPLGLQNTLSTGVVSTVSRDVNGKQYIQISNPIDHGSSGGALFNMRGEVVGVTSAGMDNTHANLNFAIPSNTLQQFLNQPQKAVQMTGQSTDIGSTSLAELKSYLDQNYGEVSYSDGYTYHFNYYVNLADDGKSYNINAVMFDTTEYSHLLAYQKAHGDAIPQLLIQMMQDIHKQGAVEPFLTLWLSFDASSSADMTGVPSDEYQKNDDGSYHIDHPFADALLDDGSGVLKFRVQPDINKDPYEYQLYDPTQKP